jgi:hypothetical protein
MLTNKEYWDKYHIKKNIKSRKSILKILEFFIKCLFNEDYLKFMKTNYSSFLFWEIILKKHLKNYHRLNIIEIGSAPGERLIKFNKKFELVPFGVEYSEVGFKKNRENFLKHKLNPKNIILADFFSKEFQDKFSNYFDVVFSWGFIEHFSNVKKVIDYHLKILKKKGMLIIVIPNIQGLNFALGSFFLKEAIAKHNLTIMDKKIFRDLFNKEKLEILYCDYFGVFNIHLFYTNKKGLRAYILKIMKNYIRPILNFLFRILFRDKGFEVKYISPYLIYVGIKK